MTPSASARAFASEILAVYDESPKVKTFRLKVPPSFTFIPGMWVMLHFEDDPAVSRAYSISTSPRERGYIEISLGNVGAFTSRLFALKAGQKLMVKGPLGKWHWRDAPRRAVLISGGTGLTPFRSMGRLAVEEGRADRVVILYSAKTPEDLLYGRDLQRFRAAGMRVFVTLTRPPQEWTGPRGRIDLGVVRREVPDFRECLFYICGPQALIADMSKALSGAGVPQASIHHERWGDYSDL